MLMNKLLEVFNRKTLTTFMSKIRLTLINPSLHRGFMLFGGIGYVGLLATCIGIATYINTFIFTNAVSELGFSEFTPVPYLFDITVITGAFIMAPSFLYIRNEFHKHEESTSKLSQILLKTGVVIGFIGAIGYVFIAVFSLDRAGPNRIYHNIFAIIAFVGFLFFILLFSFHLIFLQSYFPKAFGIFGLIAPLMSLILWALFSTHLFEWALFFSIHSFIISILFFVIIKSLRRHSENKLI